MTQIEYINQLAAIEQEQREAKRQNDIQMQLLNERHRTINQAEEERHLTALRRQKAEYAEKVDGFYARITELKRQLAVTRAEEEAAMAQVRDVNAAPQDKE